MAAVFCLHVTVNDYTLHFKGFLYILEMIQKLYISCILSTLLSKQLRRIQ